jgi:hypothetical protein
MRTSPTLITSLRSLPRAAWILFFGTFLNKFGSFVVPFLALYLTGRGYSVADAGVSHRRLRRRQPARHSLAAGTWPTPWGRRKTIALSMFSGAARHDAPVTGAGLSRDRRALPHSRA